MVLSDQHGNHLHLYERECSIQRRYQKIVEETPSTALDSKTRQEICQAAVTIARGVNYEGAGTVEFIYDEDGSFYFLEMNTRLQVEHPITEMVTGIDLVRSQILVAAGEKLEQKQEEIMQRGHALEVRYYAENPDNDFLPSTGKIEYVGRPYLNNVRLDTGYRDGNEVTIEFDPMLAKLITWGETREEAIAKMKQSFNDIPFLGPINNISYLKRILDHEKFVSGETFTHFVKTNGDELLPSALSKEEKALALAAQLLSQNGQKTRGTSVEQGRGHHSIWDEVKGFRNS
jgi:3-methylcrotonyl-CoA carboxylase alpha subunit